MTKYGKADNQALVILCPRRGRPLMRSILSTIDIVRIPASWENRWVNLIALGNDAYFYTHSAATGLVMNISTDTAVDPTSKIATLTDVTPFPMPNGAIVPYYFDATDDLFIAVMGASTGGKWFGSPSSPTTGGT
jgi:hypothetical protein